MNTPDASAALRALREEVVGHGGLAPTTRHQIDEVWPRFDQFCVAHQVQSMPCTQDTVLAFLVSSTDGLRHSSVRDLVTRLRQAHVLEGYPQPDWPRVKKYLGHVWREAPAREPKVNALREREVEQMVSELGAPSISTPEVTVLRGLVCMARRGFVTSWGQVGLRGVEVAAEDDLQFEGRPLGLAHTSLEFDLILRASLVISNTRCSGNAPAERSRVVNAGRRAGLLLRQPRDVVSLSDTDFYALLAHCDPMLGRRTRDLAWLTLGISAGLRHISLANLDLQDVTPVAGGFQVGFRFAKLSAGETLVKEFRHLSGDPASCLDLLCPACALRHQLDLVQRQGRTDGPVLATRYAGQWRTMTRQNARLRILDAYDVLAPGEEKRRIATRSLRRTAATWACAAGMSMSEAANRVTDHKTLDVFAGYVELGKEYEVHPPYLAT